MYKLNNSIANNFESLVSYLPENKVQELELEKEVLVELINMRENEVKRIQNDICNCEKMIEDYISNL